MISALHQLVSMTFLGMPLVAWGGVLTLTLVIFQVLVGSRVLKIDMKYHRVNGFVILTVALVHATAALLFIFG